MKRSTTLLIPMALGLLAAGPVAAQTAVGQITSLVGKARASGPGGTNRTLACGDTIYAGDTVTTGIGSSAGILMSDVLARVNGASALAVNLTPDGTPDTTLARGRVRVIDAREAGSPAARLAARNVDVTVAGNDAEAYVLSEKIGPYAMFCEWDAPLAVNRGSESQLANPNQCVIAKDAEPLYISDAHDERIPAAGGPPCPPNLAGLAAPGRHFDPTDVAAQGPDRWSSLAAGVGLPRRDACDNPGSGCAGGFLVISEPAATTAGQPGSNGVFVP